MATIVFGGQQITRPGSYSVVDTSAMVVADVGSFRSLGFLGTAPNLKVDTDITKVLTFNSQSVKEAREILGEGDMITYMEHAWKHGADLIYVSVVASAVPNAPTDTEWQTAIDRFNKTYVDGLVPVTTNGAIMAKVDTHIDLMSNVLNRRERRGFYGHAKGASIASIKTLVASIQNDRALLASPAPYDYNVDGSKKLYDAVALASAYAGLWAVKDPQDPITYDSVKFAGMEVIYEAFEISELLEAGVAVTEETRRGFRIVQGRTTALSDDLSDVELSVSTRKDVMSSDMREFMENKYVGTAGVAGIEISIYNDAVSRIENEYLKRNNWITGYESDSVKVVKEGTSFYVDWEGKPTLPINNFLITSRFTI